jgi:hypothetical protein
MILMLLIVLVVAGATGCAAWFLWQDAGRRQGLAQVVIWGLALLMSLLFVGAGSCAGLLTFAGLGGGLRF